MKLFGSSRTGARLAGNRQAAAAAVRHRNPLKGLAVFLSCLLLMEALYFTAIFSSSKFITRWREIYITMAMNTLSHQWLATSLIPDGIIQDVMSRRQEAQKEQLGLTTTWAQPEEPEEPAVPETDSPIVIDADVTEIPAETEADRLAKAREAFFTLFYEVDEASMDAYLAAHPEVLDNGWESIQINEAGLDQNGTDIQTIYGEQILAIDVPNQILLVRVSGSGYQGVLAVAKDPSRLSLKPSSQLGVTGETVETIALANNAVLAMTGSGFIDPNGGGNGGIISGFAMCDGTAYGSHAGSGSKRLELREDNLLYICDTTDPVAEDCTDAVEWSPALIINGQDVVPWGWDGFEPRTCIGQSDKRELLMLVIEGRLFPRSSGTPLQNCADILLLHGCQQAMNLDGGTSAIMWYDGQVVTKCCNLYTPQGRLLPTAFVYERIE